MAGHKKEKNIFFVFCVGEGGGVVIIFFYKESKSTHFFLCVGGGWNVRSSVARG